MDDRIRDFECKHKNFAIAYGGDGTLLDVARKHFFRKAVFPLRDYARCDEHEHLLDKLVDSNSDLVLKQSIHPLLRFEASGATDIAASEVTVKNVDTTSCMRFDFLVNGKLYMENVICDGLIAATQLGSHGYFKSVTRTIFTGDSIGVGFICPTYGINNLVLKLADRIAIRFSRSTDVTITADKSTFSGVHMDKGAEISVSNDPERNLTLFGYDMFCCPKCRKNRNSTLVNDQYLG